MISSRKESLIKLCIKRMGIFDAIRISLDFRIKLITTNFSHLTPSDIAEIESKFSVDEYIKKLTPIFDSNFSEEELSEIIKFYSTGAGAKTVDTLFLEKIKNVNNYFSNKIEKECFIKNARK